MEPRPVKNESDEICNAAYAAHNTFMKRFREVIRLVRQGPSCAGITWAVIAIV